MTTERARDGGRVPGPGSATVLILAVAILFLSGGLAFQILLGEFGLLVAQIAFILGPALVFLRLGGFDARRTLSLRVPRKSQIGGAVLFLLGGLQLALVVTWLQSLFIPVPVEYLQAMTDVLQADSLPRFLWLVLLAALVPAVVEETLFRGVLLSSLRKKLPAWLAAVIVGLVFGLFHLTPETAFRFLPTAWLGMLLAWVVVATGSLPLSILLHFLNNTVVLALTSLPPTAGSTAAAAEQPPPVVPAVMGLVLLLWGFRILRGRGPVTARAPAPPGGDYGAQPYR